MSTRTADRSCNLTLSRAEWSILVSLLDRTRDPIAAQAKLAIGAAVNEADGAAEFSIDKDCEKWAAVVNLAFKAAKRQDERDVVQRMIRQVSAAKFTSAW